MTYEKHFKTSCFCCKANQIYRTYTRFSAACAITKTAVVTIVTHVFHHCKATTITSMAEMINDSMTLVLLFMSKKIDMNYKCLTNYNHSLQTKAQSNANDNGIL